MIEMEDDWSGGPGTVKYFCQNMPWIGRGNCEAFCVRYKVPVTLEKGIFFFVYFRCSGFGDVCRGGDVYNIGSFYNSGEGQLSVTECSHNKRT